MLVGSDARIAAGLAGDFHPSRLINLTGKTSLRELLLLCGRFKFFIGPDSGPSHIASSLGIPTVFLYSGSNDFNVWRPLAENATVLRNPVPCAPCGLEVCNVQGHPCMSGITPQSVLDILEKQVQNA